MNNTTGLGIGCIREFVRNALNLVIGAEQPGHPTNQARDTSPHSSADNDGLTIPLWGHSSKHPITTFVCSMSLNKQTQRYICIQH